VQGQRRVEARAALGAVPGRPGEADSKCIIAQFGTVGGGGEAQRTLRVAWSIPQAVGFPRVRLEVGRVPDLRAGLAAHELRLRCLPCLINHAHRRAGSRYALASLRIEINVDQLLWPLKAEVLDHLPLEVFVIASWFGHDLAPTMLSF
jgi:hypothetical protein